MYKDWTVSGDDISVETMTVEEAMRRCGHRDLMECKGFTFQRLPCGQRCVTVYFKDKWKLEPRAGWTAYCREAVQPAKKPLLQRIEDEHKERHDFKMCRKKEDDRESYWTSGAGRLRKIASQGRAKAPMARLTNATREVELRRARLRASEAELARTYKSGATKSLTSDEKEMLEKARCDIEEKINTRRTELEDAISASAVVLKDMASTRVATKLPDPGEGICRQRPRRRRVASAPSLRNTCQEDAERTNALMLTDMSPTKLPDPGRKKCEPSPPRRPKTASITSLGSSDWNVHGHPPRGPVLGSRGAEEVQSHDAEEYSEDCCEESLTACE